MGKPALEIKAGDKWFVVKDFAVSIFGLSWNLSKATVGDRARMLSSFLWAPFDRSQLKVVTASFFPFGSEEPTVAPPQWAFGNIRRPPNLAIFGNSDGAGSKMTWLQNGFQSNGKYLNSGYVIAEEVKPCSENSEAVPEPATIAGLTLAVAWLVSFKKKLRASKF